MLVYVQFNTRLLSKKEKISNKKTYEVLLSNDAAEAQGFLYEGMTKLWLCLKTQMTRVRVKFLELGCHGLFLERQLEQTSSCNLVGVEEGPSLLERFMRKS